MKKVIIGIVILIIALVIYIEIDDSKNIKTDKNVSSDTYSDYTSKSDTSDFEDDKYYSSNSSPYVTSKSGYLVDNNLHPNTYSINDIGTLSGFFILKQSNSDLISVPKAKFNAFYEYTDNRLYKTARLPVCLNRSKGDKLVVVGGEWEGRSRNEKNTMTLEIYKPEFLGYGNSYMFEDLDVEDMDSVNGVSISSVNKDYAQVTQTLSGTGISCVYQYSSKDIFLRHKYLVSSQYNKSVNCGFYEGTQYKNMTVSLIHPFYVINEEKPISLNVEKTSNGYFIVNVSSLSSGLYAVDALNSNDIIVIE